MAREIDLSKKLSKDDVKWLSSRYPKSYVDRQIELAGGAKGGSSASTAQSTPEKTEEPPSGDSGTETTITPENGGEDLIGDGEPLYNPSEHNADEVVKHLATASDDEKSRILAAEAADKARSTVLNA